MISYSDVRTRALYAPGYEAHLRLGPGGHEVLGRPHLPIKFESHSIILSSSSGPQSLTVYNLSNGVQTVQMGANPVGSVTIERGGVGTCTSGRT